MHVLKHQEFIFFFGTASQTVSWILQLQHHMPLATYIGPCYGMNCRHGMNCRPRQFMPMLAAWIVAGDNSCRKRQHELSPATIHAGNVAYVMNITGDNSCRMKKIIGIYCRRRHILTPSRPMFIFIFFLSIYCFFNLVKSSNGFFCVIRHTQIYQTKIILKTYFMMI